MKRSCLLTVIAAALVFAGCGSSESDDLSGQVSEQETVSTTVTGLTEAESSSVSETVTTAGTTASSSAKPDSEKNMLPMITMFPQATETETTTAPEPASVTTPQESSEPKSGFGYDMDTACLAVTGLYGDGTLSAFGSSPPSDEAMAAVSEQLDALTSQGSSVSLVLLDLDTMSGVSYNSGAGFCTQSVIKALYVGSLIESEPSVFSERYEDVYETLVHSLNDNYHSLREDYGSDCLSSWCAETGVSQSLAYTDYPVMSAADMAKLWTRLCRFLNTTDTGRQLSGLYQHSIGSAGALLLGGSCTVHSKAGWECGAGEDAVYYDPDAYIPDNLTDGDPYNDECAANDAGIVYTGSGAYLYVVFSDIPYGVFEQNTPDNPLLGLIGSMNDLISIMHNARS